MCVSVNGSQIIISGGSPMSKHDNNKRNRDNIDNFDHEIDNVEFASENEFLDNHDFDDHNKQRNNNRRNNRK